RIAGEWLYLEPERAYPARWIEGAKESDRRQRRQAQHVSALAREAPEIDPVALKIRWGKRQEGAALSAPLRPLDLGERARDQAAAIRTRTSKPPAPSDAELRR